MAIDPGTPDPTARFASHADAYARGRPGYPAALVPMLQAIGIRSGTVIADLGAGTGQSCEVLLATGARVIAVEPNAPMRAHAAQRFAGEPRFSVVAGRAEATTLGDAAIDLERRRGSCATRSSRSSRRRSPTPPTGCAHIVTRSRRR